MELVNRPGTVALPQMLSVPGDEAILLQRLEVVGQRTDRYSTLTRQSLLRGPAATLLVRPVGKGHKHELAAS